MSKFGSYYGLCPLVNQNDLIGVSSDAENGCAIVTLCKNIVIRFKLNVQKQIGSWSTGTKDKLTAPVVYYSGRQLYLGAFNYDQLRMWSLEELNLDKIKKYKFQRRIHVILPQGDDSEPVLVFNDGTIQLLDQAIESRKEDVGKMILAPMTKIEDCRIIECGEQKFVAIFVRNKKEVPLLKLVEVATGELKLTLTLVRKFDQDVKLLGHTIVGSHVPSLLTVWSDGQLFSAPISVKAQEPVPVPGSPVCLLDDISLKNPVTLVPLATTHVAVYGGEPSEEGAQLRILNLQFSVAQARLRFKLLSKPARVWLVGDCLLLAEGKHLVAVPFKLQGERLVDLIGAHKKPLSKPPPALAVRKFEALAKDARKLQEVSKLAPPRAIKKEVSAHLRAGHSVNRLFEELMPTLLKNKNMISINWFLDKFHDIPEKFLVSMLKFAMSVEDRDFHQLGTDGPQQKPETNDTPMETATADGDEAASVAVRPTPPARLILLSRIFEKRFSDSAILRHVRLLSMEEVMTLLGYLAYLLTTDCESKVSERKLVAWVTALLDAHYQQYILSKNPVVTRTLDFLQEFILGQLSCINDLKDLAPKVERLASGRPLVPEATLKDRWYYVEEVVLDYSASLYSTMTNVGSVIFLDSLVHG